MKFLCLAYGDEAGWSSLSENEKREALARDQVIRDRGSLTSAVQPKVTSVRNWDRNLQVTDEPFLKHGLPLAGFSVIEAESLDEVVELVSNTRCARARGVIEIRLSGSLVGRGMPERTWGGAHPFPAAPVGRKAVRPSNSRYF